MRFIASIAVAEALSRLTCFHGESGRERVGNARTRRRDRRNIGPLLVAPALMCGGSERAKRLQIGIAHTRPRLKEDRDALSLSSQWLESAAVGMKQRVWGISGLPCPSQEKGNRYCDVLKGVPIREPASATFRPSKGEVCPDEPIRKPTQGVRSMDQDAQTTGRARLPRKALMGAYTAAGQHNH